MAISQSSVAHSDCTVCSDYKVSINVVADMHYPLPIGDDIFVTLVGVKVSVKIGLSNVCNQLNVDEIST